MTTATAPVAAPAADAVVAISDMTTAQLSERMGKLAERHDALKASVSEYETVKTELSVTLSEIQKRLGTATAAPAKAKSSGAPRAPRAPKPPQGDQKYSSLKEVVLAVLEKNPDGLDLNGIRLEVQGMIDRKEYHSGAKSLSAVISQAVNALKQEEKINHDRDSKKYTKKAAA